MFLVGCWKSKFIYVAHFIHGCYSKCFTVSRCVIGGLLGCSGWLLECCLVVARGLWGIASFPVFFIVIIIFIVECSG